MVYIKIFKSDSETAHIFEDFKAFHKSIQPEEMMQGHLNNNVESEIFWGSTVLK